MTGDKDDFYDWIIEPLTHTDYKIVCAYSLVDLCEIIIRNKQRFLQVLLDFINNETKSAPRLPDIRDNKDHHYIRDKNIKIKELLLLFVNNNCHKNTHEKICRTKMRLLLFNNNGKPPFPTKPIYDSEKSTISNLNIIKLINEYMTIKKKCV